jgi:hypothetical protein
MLEEDKRHCWLQQYGAPCNTFRETISEKTILTIVLFLKVRGPPDHQTCHPLISFSEASTEDEPMHVWGTSGQHRNSDFSNDRCIAAYGAYNHKGGSSLHWCRTGGSLSTPIVTMTANLVRSFFMAECRLCGIRITLINAYNVPFG